MIPLEQLRFAQKYPFTKTAQKAIKTLNVPLNRISEDVRERARIRVERALLRKNYAPRFFGEDPELLENEILSFPLAKIIVSLLDELSAMQAFAKSVANSTLVFLRSAENTVEECISLASELGLKFDLDEEGNFLVPLTVFLSIPFNNDSLKLVNRVVENGMVFLSTDLFALFLSEKAYSIVLKSLPVKDSGFPSWIKEAVRVLSDSFKKKKRSFFKGMTHSVKPEFFPPCISELFEGISSGKNLPHIARFYLTTFLNAVGMPQEEIVKLFSHTPNYSERITRYQVKKICTLKGKGYSPPTCTKLKASGLCKENCNVKSPIQFYRNKFFGSKSNEKKSDFNEQ